MRVAILANLKTNAPRWENMPDDQWDDLDSQKTINHLITALEAGGHKARFFEAQLSHGLIDKLLDYRPEICFNIAESHFGDSRESQIPAVLEMLRIPYTGSRVLALALALDKPMTKRILAYHGLPTPVFQVFESADEPLDEDLLAEDGDLRFPMFVKPSREGTSMGVSVESVVRTAYDLRQQVARQIERYNQPILVEQFIRGRELMVGMIGNLKSTAARRLNERTLEDRLPDGLTFLPILEGHVPDEEHTVYTNRIKTVDMKDYRYTCPAKLNEDQVAMLYRLAAAAFRVIGCRDVSRVDFRLDEAGTPYILEINPLPGLTPGFSDLCLQAEANGWSHATLVNSILEAACNRQGIANTAHE